MSSLDAMSFAVASKEHNNLPFACNIGVFTLGQRKRHEELLKQFISSAPTVTEMEDGFGFSFPKNAALFSGLAEWITLEDLCCPFIDFTLEYNRRSIALKLTGSNGIKEFLKQEFHEILKNHRG